MLRISGAGCSRSIKEPLLAPESARHKKKSRSREEKRKSPRTAASKLSANDETRFTSTKWNLFVGFSLTYLPSGDPFSRRRPRERSLTGSETKTPQPRCSARPRPLLLKGQHTGTKGGGGGGVRVGVGVRLARMASSPSRHHVSSIQLPPRIHALNFQTGEQGLPLNPWKCLARPFKGLTLIGHFSNVCFSILD